MLALPNVRSYVSYSGTWQASGAGSRVVLAGFTTATCGYGRWHYINALSGGRVECPALRDLGGTSVQVVADGAGSLADFSGMTGISGLGSRQFSFTAQNQGSIDLHQVQSISGGPCRLVADGAGSWIDLSSLSSFATPLGASELTARNGGTVLLNNIAFLLVNVALNFAGNPVLPPVVSAGPSLSVYGRAWHSYRVEARDTRVTGNPWQLFSRVAQTNDLQVISGPPNSWQAFRVDEFVADPPLLGPRYILLLDGWVMNDTSDSI